MPTVDQSTQERRAGTQKMLAKLQAERTEMLVLFCRVAGLQISPDDKGDTKKGDNKSVQMLLQEFCQILVDYIATAHFSVYERVAGGTERRRTVADLADKLYPNIAETTQIALDFNDKYDCEDHCSNLHHLQNDLSKLGEVLAQRIELEDQIIKLMR